MNSQREIPQKVITRSMLFFMISILLLMGIACTSSSMPNGGEQGESEPLVETNTDWNVGESMNAEKGTPLLVLRDGEIDLEKKTVEVRIDIENNPGITALQFSVHYGNELALERVKFDSRFGSYVTAPTPYENPQSITFMSPLRPIAENGHFATLVFRITDEARPNTTVHLHADIVQENTLDGDLNTVSFTVVNGIAQIP